MDSASAGSSLARPRPGSPQRRLKRRVQLAAFGVAMLVASAIGIVELALALHDLPRVERGSNEAAARLFSANLSASLNHRVDEIRQLAKSLLVWTALSDSRDRDAYLVPYLRERNLALSNSRLALLDYRGRYIAGDETLMDEGGQAGERLVEAGLTSGVGVSRMLDETPGRLWIGMPIDYPYAEGVIGLLLGDIDLKAMMSEELALDTKERGVILRSGETEWRLRGDAAGAIHAAASRRIQHPSIERLYDLELTVYSTDNPWLHGVLMRTLLLLPVSLGLALIVWRIAGMAAQAVSGRLERLARAIAENPDGAPEVIPADGEDDEISLLAEALRTALAAHRTAERALERLAYFDPLTGLMNRARFDERLGQALRRAQRTRSSLALMFIDLNRFKAVNDTFGHEAGDDLLREVARRIGERVRESDTLSRRSGDEFTLLIEVCPDQKGVVRLAEALIGRLSQPYPLPCGHRAVIGASLGIAFYPFDAQTAEELLSRADAAMYKAKARAADGYCLYSPDLGRAIRGRLELETRLAEAVSGEGLRILYQPQVDLADGRLLGVEALCRWSDPELGEVPPRVFIPVAEEIGVIRPLGLWLLRQACREVAGWKDLGSEFFLSVNLSARQLTPDFPAAVRELLAETGWPATRLELELTEASLAHIPLDGVAVLDALCESGAVVVMDDFGAGYSSLSCLRRFRFGKLKIDQSLIRDLASSEDDNLMVSTFINLSHQLGLRVIAEGVETEIQRDLLRRLDCDMAQGFLFGSPVTPLALRRMSRLDQPFL